MRIFAVQYPTTVIMTYKLEWTMEWTYRSTITLSNKRYVKYMLKLFVTIRLSILNEQPTGEIVMNKRMIRVH